MARIRSISGERRLRLDSDWQMAWADFDAPPSALDWIDAPVPGTAAQALERSSRANPDLLASLQQRHVWYRRRIRKLKDNPLRLRFEGLAPHADIHLDGERVFKALSMFDPAEIAIPAGDDDAILLLHFRPLTSETVPSGARRQRWRPHLISSPHLRNARASLIGHMSGWCPQIAAVGPYRDVHLIADGPLTAGDARVRTWMDGDIGHVELSLRIEGSDGPFAANCWNAGAALEKDAQGRWRAHLRVERPPLWWPHTHGDPHLVPLKIYGEPLDGDDDEFEIDLGPVAFRTIEIERSTDGAGFGLSVNGTPVFCRGVNWTPRDIAALGGDGSDYRLPLLKMLGAHMNMVRVPGIMSRESPAFFDLCDRFGILVWHDEPFANFDYDFEFLQREYDIEGSLKRYLGEIETSPALTVVCGGSEMAQQGAMLSLPENIWRSEWCQKRLPEIVAAVRPDVISVPNSPFGGKLPFQANAGVCHYYGVGAYKRDLDDARRANVRFATECLAFANLPQPERLLANSGGAMPADPLWKSRVVRDLKADWDFEDVRDHYLELLYGIDPGNLKQRDPARYLALSTVVPGEVMEATFAEWRRVGSATRGGLVWFLQDPAPGFGWGVLDFGGVPKPAYFALRRAFAPCAVYLTDEGVNGLNCHVINENRKDQVGASSTNFRLSLTCIATDGAVVIEGGRDISLPRGNSVDVASADLFGIFFDVTYAYRFGPPAHAVTVALLTDLETGERLGEAFHFPQGRGHAIGEIGLKATLEQVENGGSKTWALDLSTTRPAQSVHIAAEGFLPGDDWFHLAPGEGRRIILSGSGHPKGVVSALNAIERVEFG